MLADASEFADAVGSFSAPRCRTCVGIRQREEGGQRLTIVGCKTSCWARLGHAHTHTLLHAGCAKITLYGFIEKLVAPSWIYEP